MFFEFEVTISVKTNWTIIIAVENVIFAALLLLSASYVCSQIIIGSTNGLDTLYCNKCFAHFNSGKRMCFSSCGHLLCLDCSEPKCLHTSVCIVCHRTNINFVNVDHQMRADLKQLFRSPYDLYLEFSAKLKKVVEFQQNNRLRLTERQTMEKMQNAAKHVQMLKMELKKSAEKERMAQKECNLMNSEMERCKEQLHHLKTKLADCDKQIQLHLCKLKLHSKNSTRSLPSLNGNTPLTGLSFSECVMSTPNNTSTMLQTDQGNIGTILVTPTLNESEIAGRVRMPDTPAMFRGRKKTFF